MANKIRISTGNIALLAELNDSPTARKIWDALPLEGAANRWGEEIYFVIPVKAEREADARAEVEVGELGYWPIGRAFCVFFGPTPSSIDERPRAYSPVNIMGRTLDDATQLGAVQDGAKVRITRVTSNE